MAGKYNYKDVSSSLFYNGGYAKNIPVPYEEIDDESKEINFFIINRKLSLMFHKQARFLNHLDIDKAMAMDLWRDFLKTKYTIAPNWWYSQSFSGKKSNKSNFSNKDKDKLMNLEDITEADFDFLETYHKDELEYELKKIKRFN